MNNETNRLTQIIGRAADKYRGLAGLRPTEQDNAAALAIEAEYLFIRRDEMPKAEIVDHDGAPHVEVGSDAWSCKTSSPDYAKSTGLEYLAASIAIKDWHERQAERALDKRRDELARQFANDKTSYNNGISPALQAAINHIIELEASRADVV